MRPPVDSCSGVRPVQGVLDRIIQILQEGFQFLSVEVVVLFNLIIEQVLKLEVLQVGVRDRHGWCRWLT